MRRSWWAWTTLVAVLLPAATASAQSSSAAQVAISGTPRVGAQLEAVVQLDDDDDDVSVTYAWRRCDAACSAIGATGRRYAPVTADVGKRIQVEATVRGDDDDDDDGGGAVVVSSVLTAPVAAAPGGSTTPPPGSTLPPPGSSAPPPGSTASPPTTSSSHELAGSSRPVRRSPRLRVMRPAPTVRFVGFLTRQGAAITRLSVRAPRGVLIGVRCTGDGCPRRALALATAFTRLRAFERRLPAGTRLEIRVTRPGFVGKHTLIRIRRGKAPSRLDRCLYPGSAAPRGCD